METNINFSFRRIANLMKYTYYSNRKNLLIIFGGYLGGIFIFLIFAHLMDFHYRSWQNVDYLSALLFFYFAGGILFAGNSFPGFRSKEKRYSYLMIPVTSLEKYTVEFLYRVVLYIMVVPVSFYIIANCEGFIFHFFASDFVEYKFFIFDAIQSRFGKINGNEIFALIFGIFLLHTIPFAGSTFFRKSPLVKTLLSITIIIIALIFYWLALYNILHLKLYRLNSMFYISSEGHFFKLLFIAFILLNMICLTVGYFNMKEKEA